MSELSFVTIADQRRPGAPAALSVALHCGIVASAVILPSVAFKSEVHAPEDRLVVRLVNIPKRASPGDTAEVAKPVQDQAQVAAKVREAADESVQLPVGKVEVGTFDRPSGELGSALGSGGSGEVVVGGLSGETAGSKQLVPGGAVGPTDVFTPPFPSRKQVVMMVAEEAGERPAMLQSAPTPSYNEEARRLNVAGEVVLEVKLAASGEVHVLRVISGIGHGLDEAAISAVNRTRCWPALKAGHPVDVIGTITVLFKLA